MIAVTLVSPITHLFHSPVFPPLQIKKARVPVFYDAIWMEIKIIS